MKTAAKIGIEIGAAFSGKFKSVFSEANASLVKIGGEIRRLEASQKMLGNSIDTFGKMGKNVDGLRAKYAAVTAEIEKARRTQERLMSAQAGMNRGKEMMGRAGMAIGAITAATATAGLPIVQAAQFESAMLGVAKQVDGARDAGGKLTNVYYDMAKQVQLLGREIPIATNEIAEMVAAGARMGVAKDELIAFTRTASMMSEAFELPAGELAEQMGKIAGLYKIPIPAIGSLADTINYLDDNAISKGGDIVDFMTRVGGVAGAIKITDKEVAALGSTLLTLGERTETASTATNAMFQKLAAADKGTKKFKAAMEEIGMSTTAVQKGMQNDSMGTLLQVLEAVGKLPAEQRLGVLTELVGLEHSDTLAKLATNTGELRKQLGLANSEMAKGSMQREFAARLETTNAQWTIMKNRVTEVSVNLGSILLPVVNTALGAFGNLTTGLADFVRENKTLVSNVALAAATIGGIFAATKIAAFGIGLVTWAFHALKLAVMTNPIGLALTAITVAGVLLWKNWEAISAGMVAVWNTIRDSAIAAFNAISAGMTAAFTAMKNMTIAAFEAIKSAVGAVIDWLAEKTAWLFQTVDKVKAAASTIGDSIGSAWAGAKSFVGIGPDTPATRPTGQAAPPATGVSTPPAVSAVSAVPAAAGGTTVNQTNQPQYNITVQGSATDPSATAKAIRAEMDKRERENAATRRALMVDKLGY